MHSLIDFLSEGANQLQDSNTEVAVLGVPFDGNSSYLGGPSLAPAQIRSALSSGASNWAAEGGLELDTAGSWVDLGDLAFQPENDPFSQIREVVDAILECSVKVFTLGGDHSITYPVLQAYGARFPQISILQIDAHPDIYDSFEGNRLSHACPFARIMEAGLVQELIQVGIRTMNQVQRLQAEKFGVRVYEMKDWPPSEEIDLAFPTYISLDMDGLDPAFAPGVSHHEPGGLSTRDVIKVIHTIKQPVIGADLVEFNPKRDHQGITAAAAAKLFKEILAQMILNSTA